MFFFIFYFFIKLNIIIKKELFTIPTMVIFVIFILLSYYMNHAQVREKKGNWLIFKDYIHTSICNSSKYLSHQLLQFRISWTAFLDNQTTDLVGANDITAVCHNVKKWTPITFMETVPNIVCKITSSPGKRSLNNGKKKNAMYVLRQFACVYHNGLIFCLYFHLFLRFWCFTDCWSTLLLMACFPPLMLQRS